MKRFHVHLHVDNLDASIAFYSKLFAAQPTRVESDYAKWMLEDPRLNFAISTRGSGTGLDHLGFQAEDSTELAELKTRAEQADSAFLDEGATTCCYAKSDKHWVTDPQGIAWEHYLTLGNIPVFNENTAPKAEASCCAPASTSDSTSCCAPAQTQPASGSCCAPLTTAEKPRVRVDSTGQSCCTPKSSDRSTNTCC